MTFEDNGATLTIEEYGDHLIAGDLVGGEDPYSVIRLWKKAEKYADEQGKDVIVTAETQKMAEFFISAGLEPEHIVFRRRPKSGQDSTIQIAR